MRKMTKLIERPDQNRFRDRNRLCLRLIEIEIRRAGRRRRSWQKGEVVERSGAERRVAAMVAPEVGGGVRVAGLTLDMFGGGVRKAIPDFQFLWRTITSIPTGCNVNPLNYIGNEQAAASNQPAAKRCSELEPNSSLQKLHFSLKNNTNNNNSFCQDESGRIGRMLMNSNQVSTGLRLSNEDEE